MDEGKEMMEPKSVICDDYYTDNAGLRYDRTIGFLLDAGHLPVHHHGLICLEIGDRTRLTAGLEATFSLAIQNTTHDLDYCYHCYTLGLYDHIFCFEVIEHLCDPLQMLLWCRKQLKDGGKLFLSTPQRKPNWLRSKECHFHEFNLNELEYVIQKAGFKIVDKTMIRAVPWYWMFRGIRPILRFIRWSRTGIFILEKV